MGAVVLCMVLGLSSLALAQTGSLSLDQWFANHVWQQDTETDSKLEASTRLTGVKGEFNITDKIGIAGSYVFGKSEDFKDLDPKGHGELTNMGIALRYEIVPLVKLQAGFFCGTYTLVGVVENPEDEDPAPKGLVIGADVSNEYKVSGITIGAAVDMAVGDGIGIFGEAAYAPLVTAKLGKAEFKGSSMMAFEAGGKYDFGQFAVKAGYRYQGFDFKAEKDSKTSSNAAFSGFFVGGSVNF